MKLFIKRALATFTLSVLLATPAFTQETISVDHVQGTTEVVTSPAKVITFDLAALDTLDALGVDVFGVPQFAMPENLKKYETDAYEKFGSLFEPDYEAINAAQPDLIIVAGRSSGAYEELSKIAPTIDLSNDWEDFLPSVKQNTRVLGKIFEKTDAVAAMEADVDAAIAHFQDHASDVGKAFIVLTNGGKVTAYGPGSRFGFVHDTLGVLPAISDVKAATHGEAISNEFILETNPDWLIVLDRDAAIGATSGASAKATLDNELIAKTTAWQSDNVFYADSTRWYITNGGLANMKTIIDSLSDAMLPSSH